MSTLSHALTLATQQLSPTSDSARLDAECLLAFVLSQSRTFLFAHGTDLLSPAHAAEFQTLLDKRITGWPIAYLTGSREFWTLTLIVTPDTLIPRPETELLVTCALAHCRNIPEATILELGTGSGAIALSLAAERPDCHITALDYSPSALTVAQHNATTHALHNVSFVVSDWFSALPTTARFDCIVSNPPYLAENDPHLTQGDLRFESRTALVSGPTGLEAIQFTIENARPFLHADGVLLIEHGAEQGAAVRECFQAHGYAAIRSERDLQGHERVTEGHI